jgi:pimeloyl-ACP methyl ester carboxylesterase
MRAPDGYLESDGARLRFRDEGEGEAVVFIHGWTLDLEMWDAQAAEFSRAMRVIRFDRRGHGLSGGRPGYGRDEHDLEALLDHLQVPRAVLVGMSQGARTALTFALRLPQRVAALVLDGAPDFSGAISREQQLPLEHYRGLARTGTGGLAAFRDAWREHPLMQLHSGDRSATELLARSLDRYQGLDLLDPAAAEPPALDARALGRLPVPVLIVNGERDPDDRLAAASWLAGKLPRAERACVAGAGHLPNLDNPREYAEALRKFLQRQTRAAA